MEIDEILEKLKEHHEGEPFPKQIVQAAIDKQKEIIPFLLDELKWATANIQEIYNNGAYFRHIYALYLLAQFKEKQAYQLIVNLFSIPGEISVEVAEAVVTEDLQRILAAVSISSGRIRSITTMLFLISIKFIN